MYMTLYIYIYIYITICGTTRPSRHATKEEAQESYR